MLGLGMPEIWHVNSASCPSVIVAGSMCLMILGPSVTVKREHVINIEFQTIKNLIFDWCLSRGLSLNVPLTYGLLAVEGLSGRGRLTNALLVLCSDADLIFEFFIKVFNFVFGCLDWCFVDWQPCSAGQVGPLQVVTSDGGATVMLRWLPWQLHKAWTNGQDFWCICRCWRFFCTKRCQYWSWFQW